jgi:hypothetical protein
MFRKTYDDPEQHWKRLQGIPSVWPPLHPEVPSLLPEAAPTDCFRNTCDARPSGLRKSILLTVIRVFFWRTSAIPLGLGVDTTEDPHATIR